MSWLATLPLVTRMLTLVANSSRPLGTRGNPFGKIPSLPRLPSIDCQREFATSVIVDTGGEFVSPLGDTGKPLRKDPQLAQTAVHRLPTGIRHQCHCWVWAMKKGPPGGPAGQGDVPPGIPTQARRGPLQV